MNATLTYVGGPTALIEIAGVRLLTDPTFDAAGTEYPGPGYTLRKTMAPALADAALGRLDAVLLSHDHHADNLDGAGRALLARVPRVLTTQVGAQRLGPPARALAPGESVVLGEGRGAVRVTATPGRHGPVGGDRGPVIGFLLQPLAAPEPAVYVSGDTVWYEAIADIARTTRVGLALLFMGAARVAAAGPSHLTFTAGEAALAAHAFADATIVPLHYEGWEHFSESRRDVDEAFAQAAVHDRLHWLAPGTPETFVLRATAARAA